MYHVVETAKSFEEASAALEVAVADQGFSVLHIHDLGETLRNKGMDFKDGCRVFEICNPVQASRVLSIDMRLNMALPCRISVYTEGGTTRLGLIKPVQMLTALSDDPALLEVAGEVEAKMIQMITIAG